MAPPKKYLDFVESPSVKIQSKLPPYEERYYTDITCPHCNLRFIRIPSDQNCLLQTEKSRRDKRKSHATVANVAGADALAAESHHDSIQCVSVLHVAGADALTAASHHD